MMYRGQYMYNCSRVCSYTIIVLQEKLDDEYHEKMIEHEKAAEIRTAKKRNKRWVGEFSDLINLKRIPYFIWNVSVMDASFTCSLIM